jgi:tRNA(Ile)-lysidine synthase
LVLAASEFVDSGKLFALHLNYGLRGAESDADEAFCRELCERIGVPLTVVQAPADFAETGNLQDRARDLRYTAAAELDPTATILTAHTADDQAETILYRLFASPGRRALHGMPERRGNILRPLIGLRRAELREWLEARGETWREDASNNDDRFARVRARKLLADAESLHPAAVQNLLRTAELLRDESAALEDVVRGLLADATTDDGALALDFLADLPPALAGAVLRAYVEQQSDKPVPAAAHALDDALRLSRANGPKELQVEGAKIEIRGNLARTRLN